MTPTRGNAPPISPERWARIRDIFHAAAELEGAARRALLDERCGGDSALRADVESLLAAEAAAASDGDDAFLAHPIDASGLLLALDTPDDIDTIAQAARAERSDSGGLIGKRIGGYLVLGVLGQGGMGVVYEAEQQNPRRRVALKVVHGGGFGREERERFFQREAHALARLRHPGIAAIHEAATTEEGDHFFAMELVRGRSLRDHLEAAGDPAPLDRDAIRRRLGLFLEIADILGYAHQRGVIHRDLKPSNIIVADEETGSTRGRAARVKLLDFGLARFTDADMTASFAQTATHNIQGTLSYMSPEQSRGNPDDIDLRSDVYSLGVVLYEMLTGKLPYELNRTLLPEALRAIAEQAPRPPRQLNSALRGDLETILLKALEKEPDRRYASVAAMAEDVRRYLTDLPIEARPPTLAYQLRKLASRHRTATGLGAALLLAVLLGGVGTTIGFVRARQAAERAREEAATAAQVSSFLEELFRVSNPSESRGNTITARELLDAGVARIDTSLVDQPGVKARLLATMGDVYRRLGLYREARPLLESAVALRRETSGADDLEVARSEYALAGLLRRLGDFDAARVRYEEARRIREARLGPDDPDVAVSLAGLANVAMETGGYAEAESLYARCTAIIEKARGVDHPDLAIYLSNRAMLFRATGDYRNALPLSERAVHIQEKALGPDHLDLCYDLMGLASALRQLHRSEESRAVLERVLAIQTRVLGPEHTEVAETLGELGSAIQESGDPAGALPHLERATALFEKALGLEHAYTARAISNVARCHELLGNYDTAMEMNDQALGILERTLGLEHLVTVRVLENTVEVRLKAGRAAAARELVERGLAVQAAVNGPDARSTRALQRWHAVALERTGEPARGRALRADILAFLESRPAWADTAWGVVFDEQVAGLRGAGLGDSARAVEGRGRGFRGQSGT
jgi:serine/threonine protein kinase